MLRYGARDNEILITHPMTGNICYLLLDQDFHLCLIKCTVNTTSHNTLLTLYRSYSKGIGANVELQVYNVTYC
jgi:hypothetical protein